MWMLMMFPSHIGSDPTWPLGESGSTESVQTLMRISSLCSQSLWFWEWFSSFQMFSSRSACVAASPERCGVSCRERSVMRVAFSISTSGCSGETRERETVGEGRGKGRGETLQGEKGKENRARSQRRNKPKALFFICRHRLSVEQKGR